MKPCALTLSLLLCHATMAAGLTDHVWTLQEVLWNYPLPAGTAPRILSARLFILWTP